MTSVLEEGVVVAMSAEMEQLKRKAIRHFSVMYVECIQSRDGRESTEHIRILNPEIADAGSDDELIAAMRLALGRCPMPTKQAVELHTALAEMRRCVAAK